MIKIVNNTVPAALFKLGYSNDEVDAIVSYIDATGTIEGAPGILPEHLAVFDCSFKPAKGTRSIHYMGHIKMMAATQPFLSGAISKTVNLPHDASIEDIAEAYTESWRQGLKAVAIYRDGSKGSQPLNVSGSDGKASKKDVRADAIADSTAAAGSVSQTQDTLVSALADAQTKSAVLEDQLAQLTSRLNAALGINATDAATTAQGLVLTEQDQQAPPRAVRHRLPEERASLTHKFAIAGHEGYITVGLYPNGAPGEIFIRMAKEGSTVSGLMDAFATAISLSLQHGVPLKVLCEKFAHTRFEPSGWTGNEQIGYAKSIMDYIFRWLQIRFLSGQQLDLFARMSAGQQPAIPVAGVIGTLSGSPYPTASPANENVISTSASSADPAERPAFSSDSGSRGMGSTSAPAGGLPPERGVIPSNSNVIPTEVEGSAGHLKMHDRGVSGQVHVAEAMREYMDMGDAPSCGTCGAIMVRNGSCYRCMSCGSTSGCS
jgi:ribonucleoside-diphosphate reductase alpha chain